VIALSEGLGSGWRSERSVPRPKEIADPISEYQGQAIERASGRGIQPRAPSQSAIITVAEQEIASKTSA
jgi:hypothetical protein